MFDSGFNTAHTHPSATELALVVKGRMITEFVLGTGARKIRNEHNTWGQLPCALLDHKRVIMS